MRPDLTLYFIRHGETDWNKIQRYQGQADIPLNDTGRAQAARNGQVLGALLGPARTTIDYVSSPLERTRETMAIVRENMGLPPQPFPTDDRLKEQSFGYWEGLTVQEVQAVDPAGFAARNADMWNWLPPGGENYPMVLARIQPWLDALERDTVVVSHGNISRTVRGVLLGLAPTLVPRLEVPQDRFMRIKGGTAEWL